MLAHLAPHLAGTRDRVLLLMGYAGAFRRSEIAALDFADLAWVEEGAPITLRRSKSDQIFYSIKELRVLVECWRVHYNTIRPHSSLGYRAPAPQTWPAFNSMGYGEVETATRFPLPHTPDGGYQPTSLALH